MSSESIWMQGFSLLEVLVALLVLAIGLLGIAAIETTALKRNYEAYLHSVASTQLASIHARLAVGHRGAELSAWNKINAELLPHGRGENSNNQIKLCWSSRTQSGKQCL